MTHIPGIVITPNENLKVNSIEEMVEFCEARARGIVEQFGSHDAMFIGKIPDGSIVIFHLGVFALPQQQNEMIKVIHETINKLQVRLCCLILETLSIEFPPGKEYDEEIRKYQTGELSIHDCPNKKVAVQLFVQRPGSCRIFHYEILSNEGKHSLGPRREIVDSGGPVAFDFYDHSKVN